MLNHASHCNMLKEEGERAPSLSCEVVTCDDEVKSTQWNFIDGKKSFLNVNTKMS